MILYFVRHGETEWNVRKKIQGATDIPLNDHGREQAQELAAYLKKERKAGRFSAGCVYTSPQRRAAQTAQTVADALLIPCVPLDGIREMKMGDWEGLNWRTVKQRYRESYESWNADRRYVRTPNGESYNDLLKRTFDAIGEILDREQERENVLVVSHSAVLMAVRCYLDGYSFEEGNMVGRYKTKNTEVVAIQAEDLMNARKRFYDELAE